MATTTVTTKSIVKGVALDVTGIGAGTYNIGKQVCKGAGAGAGALLDFIGIETGELFSHYTVEGQKGVTLKSHAKGVDQAMDEMVNSAIQSTSDWMSDMFTDNKNNTAKDPHGIKK